jgi:hypothetical protein
MNRPGHVEGDVGQAFSLRRICNPPAMRYRNDWDILLGLNQ